MKTQIASASTVRLIKASITLALLAPLTFGQNITGTITGAVEDPSDAAVPQAAVVALNTERGISYKTVTGASGVYTLPLLPVGEYQVTIEAQGFKKFVRGGLKLGGDDRLRIDARLELGAVADTVTVSAGAPLIKTDQATLGASFTSSGFDNLPVGRTVSSVMTLVPGVHRMSKTRVGWLAWPKCPSSNPCPCSRPLP